MASEGGPEETSNHPTTSLSRDVGVSAVTAALFLLLRIFAVSRWDWDTASDVAGTVDFGSTPAIVLGTLFAEPELTAILIMILLPLIALDLAWPQGDHRSPAISRLLYIAVLGTVTIALVSTQKILWLPVGAILVAAIGVVLHLAWRHSTAHRAAQRLLRSVGLLSALGALGLAATVSTPWTALEQIETTSGTINGYVLETPSGYLKVLDADSRELLILISSEVISRQVEGN